MAVRRLSAQWIEAQIIGGQGTDVDKRVLVSNKGRFQQLVQSQSWALIENAMYLWFKTSLNAKG